MVTLSGGNKLEAALKQIATKASNAAEVRVGFLENATYPDGKPVAMIAAIQEFGAPSRGIPSRPYFRSMVTEKSGEWPDAVGKLLVTNDYDANKTLALAGQGIKGQLQQSIADFSGVPLSPDTIRAKGNDKQLVDTGHMLNSVDYEVKDERSE